MRKRRVEFLLQSFETGPDRVSVHGGESARVLTLACAGWRGPRVPQWLSPTESSAGMEVARVPAAPPQSSLRRVIT